MLAAELPEFQQAEVAFVMWGWKEKVSTALYWKKYVTEENGRGCAGACVEKRA